MDFRDFTAGVGQNQSVVLLTEREGPGNQETATDFRGEAIAVAQQPVMKPLPGHCVPQFGIS